MSKVPLKDIKVIEFSHMVMGPSAGLILADLGADVIKIEPIEGDKTRLLRGSGAGYFPMYNRNKRSMKINLKTENGVKIAKNLISKSDVLIENFRSGAMEKLGLDYESLKRINSKLIYCSNKGFLSGPYSNRTALDEVAQMMGGLAYMTGPPGKPLRAGASVIDVMGGMFGVIGIMAAIQERHETGEGQHVMSSLYESTVFLVGQHIAQYGVTGKPAPPMPERISAWAVYDIFETLDEKKVFIGVVSDTQWQTFCKDFKFDEFSKDESLIKNNDRVKQRERIIPIIQCRFSQMECHVLLEKLEKSGLPFAPIKRPQDLSDDVHMLDSNGLVEVTLDNEKTIKLPAIPIEMNQEKFPLRKSPPKSGEHTSEILRESGYQEAEINAFIEKGIVATDAS
ncbi:MAG TPA: CaiB/BaiF CoA-transferase family protein [Woeseiaceae bacterium]|nr:CaiB/BaiF CoA-transferase family protein [Woeseiaceae bacterium]